jgi:hypothetical protein
MSLLETWGKTAPEISYKHWLEQQLDAAEETLSQIVKFASGEDQAPDPPANEQWEDDTWLLEWIRRYALKQMKAQVEKEESSGF